MNNGKICVPVCEETLDKLMAQLHRAQEFADVVEVRLDGLPNEEIDASLSRLSCKKPILFTFRPQDQGGRRDLDREERIAVWRKLSKGNYDEGAVWIDQEADISPMRDLLPSNEDVLVIRSHHDFAGVPTNLDEIYALIVSDTEVGKIAVQANEITDAIELWKLLKRANSEGKRLIPIAMGEPGKWTRILGPANGAFMTYASLDAGLETAPGQISVEDMIDVYRVKELDENTLVYGIIAGNTSYSVSPWMHNAAFKASELNSVFVPLQVADLDAFFARLVSPETREIELNFKGFSVTNPHKQTIIQHLDEIDEAAKRIGAVNTVKIEDGKFYGYNTDAPGFIQPLKRSNIDLARSRVAVFGAGGAARACIHMLQQEGANVTVVARNKEKGRSLARDLGTEYRLPPTDDQPLAVDFDMMVNTTPLGTAGLAEELSILKAAQLEGLKLVYDLVYNPSETALLKEARIANVPTFGGLEMLLAQGARQFEIWTGRDAPLREMEAAVRKRLNI